MIVTNVGRGAVDATVSGAQAVAGRDQLRERSSGARRTALQRTAKTCGPDASTLASSLAEVRKAQPGSRASFRKATETRQPATPG